MVLILQTLFAGALGTLAMTLVMTLIHRSGRDYADMIRVIGSFVTRSYENAVLPGIAIHLTVGMLFAIPYAIVLTLVSVPSAGGAALLGGILGLLHGILGSLVLVALVTKSHPVERFRRAGVEVAIAYIAGHIVYGVITSATIGGLGLDWHWIG